jgi:hypothetical protein
MRLSISEQASHTAVRTAEARRARLLQVRAAEKDKAARQSRAYRDRLEQRTQQQVAVKQVLTHTTPPPPPHTPLALVSP